MQNDQPLSAASSAQSGSTYGAFNPVFSAINTEKPLNKTVLIVSVAAVIIAALLVSKKR